MNKSFLFSSRKTRQKYLKVALQIKKQFHIKTFCVSSLFIITIGQTSTTHARAFHPVTSHNLKGDQFVNIILYRVIIKWTGVCVSAFLLAVWHRTIASNEELQRNYTACESVPVILTKEEHCSDETVILVFKTQCYDINSVFEVILCIILKIYSEKLQQYCGLILQVMFYRFHAVRVYGQQISKTNWHVADNEIN